MYISNFVESKCGINSILTFLKVENKIIFVNKITYHIFLGHPVCLNILCHHDTKRSSFNS